MSTQARIDEFSRLTLLSFKQNESKLLLSTNRDGRVSGGGAFTWAVVNEQEEATTRNIKGNIPYEVLDKTQYQAVLEEWHGTAEETGFNVFTSQGADEATLRKACLRKLNRKIDAKITAQLEATTNAMAGTQTLTKALITEILATLGSSNILETEGDIFGSVSPSVYQRVMALAEASSIDFVDMKTFERDGVRVQVKHVFGINWINNTQASGKGTNASTNVIYHRDAIGFAAKDKASPINSIMGYEEKQDRSYARCTGFFNAKILEDTGALKFTHDDTASY